MIAHLLDVPWTSYFVNQICELLHLPAIAAAFPPNKTKRTLKIQIDDWRKVHQRLREVDSLHTW